MSKKKKLEETTETISETVVSTLDEPLSEETEDVPTVATDTNISDSGEYTGLENFNEVSQMTMVSLYNRNIHPVTIRLSDGSELVLSPQQKTEPLEENLILDLPVGVLKV